MPIATNIQLQKIYSHMDQTFLVMLDRSMWFSPSYEALVADKMRALAAVNPNLVGKENQAMEPLTYAFSYAATVFLCTAVEQNLLHHYMNSVVLFQSSGLGDFDRLPALKTSFERRKAGSWESFLKSSREKQGDTLRGMSLANLAAANEYFSDIYGPKPLQSALGKDGFSWLQKTYEDLQAERNGIVHRGGELKTGKRIEANRETIQGAFTSALRVRDQMLQFSHWCRNWWLKQ